MKHTQAGPMALVPDAAKASEHHPRGEAVAPAAHRSEQPNDPTSGIAELARGMLSFLPGSQLVPVLDGTMSDSGLRCGDVVLLQPSATFDEGQLVMVRLIRTGRTLLRRAYRRGNRVVLVAETGDGSPMRMPRSSIRVLGVVAAVVRAANGRLKKAA